LLADIEDNTGLLHAQHSKQGLSATCLIKWRIAMHIFWRTALAGIAALCLSTGALAAEKSTPEQAVAMVKKAVAYYKEVGKEKALAEFNNPTGQFRKGDLYLFAYDRAGVSLAHINPKMVGKNLIEMRDVDGKYLNKEFIALGDSKEGRGWLEYKWPNPVTKELDAKKSYVEKVDDIYIICGVYK
jgi:signal transduction histidine kinase